MPALADEPASQSRPETRPPAAVEPASLGPEPESDSDLDAGWSIFTPDAGWSIFTPEAGPASAAKWVAQCFRRPYNRTARETTAVEQVPPADDSVPETDHRADRAAEDADEIVADAVKLCANVPRRRKGAEHEDEEETPGPAATKDGQSPRLVRVPGQESDRYPKTAIVVPLGAVSRQPCPSRIPATLPSWRGVTWALLALVLAIGIGLLVSSGAL